MYRVFQNPIQFNALNCVFHYLTDISKDECLEFLLLFPLTYIVLQNGLTILNPNMQNNSKIFHFL